MASNISPHRESLLVWKEKTAKDEQRYHCDYCQIDMEKITTCPDCRNKLSLIQACGVTNYFCFFCNELKSKSRINVEFEPNDEK